MGASQATALSDPYLAMGEDLDYLIESGHGLAIEEMEYELRKFVLFREVEDFIFNLNDEYIEEDK
ncbi:MAG: hypothetical protein L3J51_02015 [Cocleimonas sp.]|nr:hypothetical protein [Cocleimonas sp.]